MKKVLFKIIGAAGVCLFCTMFAQGETIPAQGEAEGSIIARVNGVGITLQSLDSLVNLINMQQSMQHGMKPVNPEEKDANRKKALDRLILDELAWQKAKAEGFKADPSDVEKNLEGLKTKLGDEAFKQMMEREHLTEEILRTRIERSLVIRLIFDKEVVEEASKILVTEDDLKREYEKEKTMFTMPEKIEVSDVVFFLEPEDPQSAQIAERVLEMILTDKDRNPFNLASDGNYAVYDTEVKKQKDPELYQVARKLQVGELSGVIIARDSLHIIKLKSYSPEIQVPFEKAKGYLETNLKTEALRNRALKWETELKKDAKIEIFEDVKGKK